MNKLIDYVAEGGITIGGAILSGNLLRIVFSPITNAISYKEQLNYGENAVKMYPDRKIFGYDITYKEDGYRYNAFQSELKRFNNRTVSYCLIGSAFAIAGLTANIIKISRNKSKK